MVTLAHMADSAAYSAGITGLVYAGAVGIIALTSIAAPTAERRRDARKVLKIMLHARR